MHFRGKRRIRSHTCAYFLYHDWSELSIAWVLMTSARKVYILYTVCGLHVIVFIPRYLFLPDVLSPDCSQRSCSCCLLWWRTLRWSSPPGHYGALWSLGSPCADDPSAYALLHLQKQTEAHGDKCMKNENANLHWMHYIIIMTTD